MKKTISIVLPAEYIEMTFTLIEERVTMKKRIMVSDKILMKRLKLDEVMRNGLIRSANSMDYSNLGVVIEIGPGLERTDGSFIPMRVRVGDTLVIPAGGIGRPIEIDEEEFIVLRESEIMCILREEEIHVDKSEINSPTNVATVSEPRMDDDFIVRREVVDCEFVNVDSQPLEC
jgi:chaperonin GroES